jgi:hypothetical protein
LQFHKYFRISRQRFDMIYEAVTLSGLFGVYPDEPIYSEVHPEDPGRPGKHQDHKRIPLCLMIGVSMGRVASGNTFCSLGEEVHSREVLLNVEEALPYSQVALVGGDIEEIENMLFSCFIIHNMNLTDKDKMDLGHMIDDWCDHVPGANRERRVLYDIVNDRTLLFNTCAYIVTDNTDFSLLGCQIRHPNFCNDTNTVTPTENDSDFMQRREVFADHHEIVRGPCFSGPQTDQRMWLLPAEANRTYP